jgi:hypothetical protein
MNTGYWTWVTGGQPGRKTVEWPVGTLGTPTGGFRLKRCRPFTGQEGGTRVRVQKFWPRCSKNLGRRSKSLGHLQITPRSGPMPSSRRFASFPQFIGLSMRATDGYATSVDLRVLS